MQELVDGLARIRDEHGGLPVTAATPCTHLPAVRDLKPSLTMDRWGRPLWFLSSGTSYVLWSLGRDGVQDDPAPGGPQVIFEADTIVFNGRFWQYPEGTNRSSDWFYDRNDRYFNPFELVERELRVATDGESGGETQP